MFVVHRSNRMEELVAALGTVTREPLEHALMPEVVVVQSRGMERWLAQSLSERFGVWANAECPFPRAFVERVLDAVLDESTDDRFSRDRLTWAIAALLPQLSSLAAFSPVARFLADDDRGLKRFDLAAQIANVFDQYAVFRPELVLAWQSGTGEGWQPPLWRALVQQLGEGHLAARAHRLMQRFPSLRDLPAALPRRVSIFGVSSLPPAYISIFGALATRLDVHLFQLSPSPEYWAHVRSKREALREARASGGLEALTLDNSLLGSLGRAGRQQQEVLESSIDYTDGPYARYVDPGEGSLLTTLQSDIMALRARGSAAPPKHLRADDASVIFHSCHGPMREVEVLRDRLLGLLDDDGTLQPRDIVVMTPDIDAYAPYIDAVFGAQRSGREAVPYRISDRSERHASPVAASVLALLAAAGGRMTASTLLDLLQLQPIRARFALAEDDVAELTRLVHAAGVRWGIDGAHRARLGLPAVESNSWRHGLTRLLLGHALPLEGRDTFCDVLPFDDVEGETAVRVGKLARFAEILFERDGALSDAMSLPQWRAELFRLITDLVQESDENAWQVRAVREVIDRLVADAELAAFDEAVPREVIARALRERLTNEKTSHDFLAGGITFCALLPMRSIPFRVVCLLGMNDGAFPRIPRPPSFDRVAAQPRAGDRNVRDEDRHLFLEAILSARQHLHLSWVGRGIQDDAERPPSVVVGELMDAVARGFAPAGERRGQLELRFDAERETREGGVLGQLLLEHPLQSFSERYFRADTDPRLFSFAADAAAGAAARRGQRRSRRLLFSEPLPLAAEERTVTLQQLLRFFDNPARHVVERSLGVWLREDALRVEDREPTALDALGSHQVGARLIDLMLAGISVDRAAQLVVASGALPHGALGEQALAAVLPKCEAIAKAALRWRAGGALPPLSLSIELDSARLEGVLSDLYRDAMVRVDFGRLNGRRQLGSWLRHLALCASASPPGQSVLVARSSEEACVVSFGPLPPERARMLLAELIAILRRGERGPLPFFPDASLAYTEALLHPKGKGDARDKALRAAHASYTAAPFGGWGVEADEYVARVYEGDSPIAPAAAPLAEDWPGFEALALAVFTPMLEARSEEGTP